MKGIPHLFLSIAFFISCNKEDVPDVELLGRWKLIEVLSDPGDGSGTYKKVESDKVITFNTDGTITSNGNLCDSSSTSDNPTSGTFDKEKYTFSTMDCQRSFDPILELNESTIIVNFPCREPCGAKYKKQ